MWLFTVYGFFSVVCVKNDHTIVMVRARRKEHLVKLQAAAMRGNYTHEDEIAEAEILDQPGSDYRWRIKVNREAWANFAFHLSMGIDYNNFKSEVSRVQGSTPKAAGDTSSKTYTSALHDIWSVMGKTQETRPYMSPAMSRTPPPLPTSAWPKNKRGTSTLLKWRAEDMDLQANCSVCGKDFFKSFEDDQCDECWAEGEYRRNTTAEPGVNTWGK